MRNYLDRRTKRTEYFRYSEIAHEIAHHWRLQMGDFQYSETPIRTLADLGRAIRQKRKSSGLRIDDAAALCGVSVDLLSRLENGKSGVATDRVLKVLDGLGIALRVVDQAKLPRA